MTLGLSIHINNEEIVFDVSLICGSYDAPAKAAVQNIMQHNGFFSCHYCEHPGETVNGRVKYPVKDMVPQRNHEHVLMNMREASISNRIIKGFKGFSALALAPNFNMVYGFAIDAMHSDFLGLGRQLIALYVDTSNHQFDFYIGRQINQINDNILKIKLSCHTDRNPRLLNERKTWKANEWRNWVLHYSVGVLYGILPETYLINYCKFVNAMCILYNAEVSEEDLKNCDNLITSFRKEFQEYFGLESMTYNCHTFSHLVECVRNLGPLWNYSNFPFESNNGVLVGYVKSPKGVINQMLNKYAASRYLTNQQPAFTDVVSNYVTKCSSSNTDLKTNKVLGKGFLSNMKNIEEINFHQIPFLTYEFQEFKRFVWNEQIYTTKQYSSKFKTNDSAIKLNDGKYGEIIKIFKSSDDGEVYIIVDLYIIDTNHVIGRLCTNYAIINSQRPITTAIVPMSFIKCKCVLIELETIKYFSDWIHFYDRC